MYASEKIQKYNDMQIIRTARLIAIIIVIASILAMFLNSLTAHAVEENAITYKYYYTLHAQALKNDDSSLFSEHTVYYEYETSETIAGFLDSVDHVVFVNSEENRCCFVVTEIDDENFNPVIYTLPEIGDTSSGMRYNDIHIYSSYDYTMTYTASTNVPLFGTYEEMINYFETGDATGALNLPSADVTDKDFYDSSYSLENFTANGTITATWTGTTARSKATEIEEVNEWVQLYVGYAYNTSPKQIAVREELSGRYPTADNGLTIDKSSLEHDDESLYLRYVEFYPMYSASQGFFGAIYYGNPSYIYFNPDGTIEKAITSSTGIINRSELTDNIDSATYDEAIPALSDLERINNGFENPLSSYSQSVTFNWSDRYDSAEYYIQVRTTFRYKLGSESAWNEVTVDTSVPTGRYSTLVDSGTFTYKYGDYVDLYWIEDNNPFTDDSLDKQGNIQPIKDSIRIVKISNGTVTTGAWTTFTLKNGVWQTGQVTDTSISEEITEGNTGGNIPEDTDDGTSILNGFDPSDIAGLWKSFTNIINSLFSFVGNFPSLFATVFGFLPVEIRNMIYTAFIALCTIGIIKAVIS